VSYIKTSLAASKPFIAALVSRLYIFTDLTAALAFVALGVSR
jgi:hypothetical protein